MASKRLFIGNLPLNTNEESLKNEFGSYGDIEVVEIKNKKNAFDEETCFAFISMKIDERVLQQCIREFKEQKFNGNYLSVSLAKESFLDRLKREREGGHPNDADSKRIKVQVKHDFTANLNPKRQQQRIYNDQHFGDNEDYFEQPAEENINQQPHNKLYESERKRVESVKKLADFNKQKKNLIKSALSNIDNSKNKIVFDDNENHSQEPQTSCLKSQKTNPTLFNDDEEEDYNHDFQIKEQFQGVKGQKLLELQTRYKSDQRFQLDERFKADYDEHDEEQQNGDQQEQNGHDDEREQQLKILENVVGKPLSRNNVNVSNQNQNKKSIMMMRFDPTKNEHQNLSNRLPGRKAAACNELHDKPIGELIVSQETFYKVSDNLKSALKSNETSNGFSLLGMFGKVDDDDNDDRGTGTSHQMIDTNKKKKHKEKNPFKYDSSESEDEVDFKKIDKLDKTKTELYRETFFYVANDQRLKDGAQFYRMIESTEHSNFDEYRGELKKVVRKKFKKYQQKAGGRMNTFKRKKK